MPDTFKAALGRTLESQQENLAGIYVRFDFYFLGRCLKHAYEAPPMLRIVRRGKARWFNIGGLEYCALDGMSVTIQERLIHRDLKGLSYWIERQNRHSTCQALSLLQSHQGIKKSMQANERKVRVWLRHKLYYRLPPFIRPFIYFLYRYILRLGFLDGKAGFAYTFLQGWWHRLLIDLKLEEMRQRTG